MSDHVYRDVLTCVTIYRKSALTARLAGQFAEYTEAQMKTFRTGERANDANKMMRSVAAKISDDDIRAVADYIAGLP